MIVDRLIFDHYISKLSLVYKLGDIRYFIPKMYEMKHYG